MVAEGGRGGDASATGENSSAEGGTGGDAVIGNGGRGGDAKATGRNSGARGGDGGRGGIGPGGPGGDIVVDTDNSFGFGGQGGEANQADGRGGRGGQVGNTDILRDSGITVRTHMRWPYDEPITEPGRGGDAPDTTQYKARRLIIEQLKKQYLRAQGQPTKESWWDRKIVPMDWLNTELKSLGHRWKATIVADEYEFSDTAD